MCLLQFEVMSSRETEIIQQWREYKQTQRGHYSIGPKTLDMSEPFNATFQMQMENFYCFENKQTKHVDTRHPLK